MIRTLFFCLTFFPFLVFSSNTEERLQQLEIAFEKHSQKRESQAPPSRAHSSNLIGIFFSGDALFWRAQSGGKEYVYDYVSQKMGKKSVEENSPTKEYGMGPGFRVGAGFKIPLLGWVISSEYAQLKLSDDQKNQKNFPPILMQIKGGLFSSSHIKTSNSTFSYKNIDIDLIREILNNRLISFKTLLGVKTSWIDINKTLSYQLSGSQGFLVEDHSDFSGVGPTLGFDLTCHLFLGFGLGAQISGGCLFGSFDVHHKEETGLGEIKLQGSKRLFLPTLNFFIGPSWTLSFKRCRLSIKLGYEAGYFWSLNQSAHLETMVDPQGGPFQGTLKVVRPMEDITLYGATLKACLGF